MNRILCFLHCLSSLFLLGSQLAAQSFVVSGFVKDEDSGEALEGAYVFDSISLKACFANDYGYFSMPVDSARAKLLISFVGYQRRTFLVNDLNTEGLVYQLKTENSFEEVLVLGSQPINRVSGSSEILLPMKMIREMPSFLGEPDLFKAIMHLPGVQSGVEGTAGLHVRGGSPDQNLILLDEVPLYNVSHLLGFFSVFNMDAIRSASFIKGGLPAHVGGRLSSVLDVKMKEGNLKEFKGAGSVGLLSSQLMVEGPIVKGKLGYMAAIRRTYSDLLYRPVLALASDVRAGYHFYDANGTLYWNRDSRNSFYYSLYKGDDKGYVKELDSNGSANQDIRIKWGNTANILRWNHVFRPRMFSNLSLALTSYGYLNAQEYFQADNPEGTNLHTLNQYRTSVRDVVFKYDVEQKVGRHHGIRYGLNGTYHFFQPGVSELKNESIGFDSVIVARNIRAQEVQVYAEDAITLFGDRLEVNAGLRFSSYFVDDTAYFSPEPRLSALLKIGKDAAVKLSYSRLTQYVGLLNSAYVGLPTDLWIPSTRSIPPQRSDLWVLGYHHNFDWMNFTLESYYRKMSGLVEFKDGASFQLGREDWENLVATGTGEAYGFEFLAEKNFGRVSGWLAYTLSWSNRHFPGIDEDFPYKYDRRHNLSITSLYKLSERATLSASWVLYSGENITLSEGRYITYPSLTTGFEWNQETLPGSLTTESLPDRNNLKMPAYHRLDAGVSLLKQKKNGERTWRFGIYNLYNRQNTFFVMMYANEKGYIKFNRYSFTPFMPYVRYEFNF
ncbi:MAG: carboxypeptidase-like regulatory domain-containing protein [Bacteroidales bacterium]